MPILLRRVIGMLVGLALLVNLWGLPAVEAGFLISEKDEIAIGRDVGKQLEKQYGLVEDAALQERVNRIGMSMVAVSDRRNLPYSFKVLNSSEVNALAAPGGFIYIFKGLVDLMPSDDELAGVIGHELGHVVRRHTVHQIEKSMGIGLLFGVVFGGRGALLQNLAYNAIMAGYSRADEREADHLGFIHSFRAGYNPYSMTMGLTKLAELDPKSHNDLFSDHPEGQARLALVQQYLNETKVYPQVRSMANGKAAQVVDGDWALPTVEADYAGNKPLNRAYSTAGRLYRLAQLPDYNSDNYILDSDGSNVIVYYNDQLILTVTPQDGAAHDMSAMELAGMYAGKLREWNIHVALDKAG